MAEPVETGGNVWSERRRTRRRTMLRAALGTLAFLAAGATLMLLSGVALREWLHDQAVLAAALFWQGWLVLALTGAVLFALLRLLRMDVALHRHARRVRDRLRAHDRFHESIIDHAGPWLHVLDAQGRVTLWNRTAERLSGHDREDVLGHDAIWQHLFPDPGYRSGILDRFTAVRERVAHVGQVEIRIRCRNGQEQVVAWTLRRLAAPDGSIGVMAIGRPVIAQRVSQELLRQRDRQLALLMAHVPGMVVRRHGRNWTLSYASGGCLALTGYAAYDLVDDRNIPYASLIDPHDRERMQSVAKRAALHPQTFTLEYRIRHRNGELRWVREQARAVDGEDGVHLEGIIVDISDRMHRQLQLEHMAARDALTGLHTFQALLDALDLLVQRARRERSPLGLLWVDIDGFAHINRQHGHHAGDALLQDIAQSFKILLRPADMAARSGTAFVLALPGLDEVAARQLAAQLQLALRTLPQPETGTTRPPLTASIGLATLLDHACDAQVLVRLAEEAMDRARHAGRGRIVTASSAPSPAASTRPLSATDTP